MQETLESYSTHLLKPIWDRVEQIYAFMKDNLSKWKEEVHPLVDFQKWLIVLNRRALTHENVNV